MSFQFLNIIYLLSSSFSFVLFFILVIFLGKFLHLVRKLNVKRLRTITLSLKTTRSAFYLLIKAKSLENFFKDNILNTENFVVQMTTVDPIKADRIVKKN